MRFDSKTNGISIINHNTDLMPEHQSLIPHIKRVAVTNLLLFLFFMSPSFLSFFALVIAIFVIIFDNPYETFSALLNTPQDHHMSQTINELFKKYNSLGLLERNV